MGSGTFAATTQKFNLILSIRHNATTARLDEWRTAFQQASERLFDATDGQHQFGDIYVCNNCTGGRNADMWLRKPDGTAIPGGYAILGNDTLSTIHATLYGDGRFKPVSVIVHEFGHYVYGLYDEYDGPQGDAECIGDVPPGDACIMETKTEAPSEFCVASNHDPDADTWQALRTQTNLTDPGDSCWQTMVNRYTDLVLPADEPVGPAPTQADAVDWIMLAPEQRFVLVVDRSNSMSGNKLTEAKYGADWWAQNAVAPDPTDFEGCAAYPLFLFGVVSYSHTVSIDYPLHLISGAVDRSNAQNAIDLISAGGWTAIGDGLREGLRQITDACSRAATQVIVLLTDGLHNTGEDPSNVLPDLVANGVRVYTIGIGSGINVNLLLEIATSTGGKFYRIDPTQEESVQEFEIRNALIDISGTATENGGLVTTIPGSTNPDVREEKVYVETGSNMATFALSWKNPQDLLFLELESPDGDYITLDSTPDNVRSIYNQRPYMGFQVKEPIAGMWRLIVKPERVNEVAHFRLFVFSQNPHIDGGLSSPWRYYRPGDIIPLQFQCYFDQPITGLKVIGTVLAPSGKIIPLDFRDDGNRELDDMLPGDGLYSTLFRDTRGPGMYTIKVIVESDGKSVSYGRIGERSEDDEEDERPPIPPFRRQFTRTVGVGEVPFKDVKIEPNSGNPGERLDVTLKGHLTHFRRGFTSADFGEGIDTGEVEVLDKHTARVPITINEKAQLGYRDVTAKTAIYRETIEVEGGFQVVRRQSIWDWLSPLRQMILLLVWGIAAVILAILYRETDWYAIAQLLITIGLLGHAALLLWARRSRREMHDKNAHDSA